MPSERSDDHTRCMNVNTAGRIVWLIIRTTGRAATKEWLFWPAIPHHRLLTPKARVEYVCPMGILGNFGRLSMLCFQ